MIMISRKWLKTKMNDAESYISTRKAAELLSVSLRTVQLWVEKGTLLAWKTAGGHRRISMDSVTEILKKRKESTEKSEEVTGLVMVLVEDDEDIRDAYSASIMMTGLPIKLVTAVNGYDGLLQIGKYKPDIIMTDLMMPKMDGYEMIKTITQDESMKKTLIIIVTAMDERSIEQNGVNKGEFMILHKPLRFEMVESVLMDKLKGKNKFWSASSAGN